jgi:transcriptional regulator of heat shock response
MGFRNMPIGIVAGHFRVKNRNGALGVIGPVRQSYASLVPTIRYYKNMLEEVMGL